MPEELLGEKPRQWISVCWSNSQILDSTQHNLSSWDLAGNWQIIPLAFCWLEKVTKLTQIQRMGKWTQWEVVQSFTLRNTKEGGMNSWGHACNQSTTVRPRKVPSEWKEWIYLGKRSQGYFPEDVISRIHLEWELSLKSGESGRGWHLRQKDWPKKAWNQDTTPCWKWCCLWQANEEEVQNQFLFFILFPHFILFFLIFMFYFLNFILYFIMLY